MAVAEVTNNNVTKNHHDHQSLHAFIHLAFPLKTYDHPHIGVIIDNRKKEPICIIFESDVERKEDARMLLQNFFGGENIIVWVQCAVVIEPKLLNQNDLM